jgi:RNA polymerase sigma factor (sigma-70 family)
VLKIFLKVIRLHTQMMETILQQTLTTEQQNRAIGETLDGESKRLFDFIRRRVPTDDDAEDILQDVFYQFVNTMRLEPIERAASWLFKVAGNKIIDWYRKKKPERLERKSVFDDEDETSSYAEDLLFNHADEPDEQYARTLVWDKLYAALNELPEEQREVFVMQELDEMSFKDIAAITGEPVNTLISRKRYAVLHLRERLKGLYDEFFDE